MKYVSVITDYPYLLWQQEIQIFNFKKLGLLDKLVVVVLHEPGVVPSEYAKRLGTLAEIHYYENDQIARHYIPSNKPWGLMKLLTEFPSYGSRVFLLDQDVIFREQLDFSQLDGVDNQDSTWYVSDTIGYIAYHYLQEQLGETGVEEMAGLLGLTGARIKAEQKNSGGAQYYMKNLTADFCRQVAEDSVKIYDWAVQQKRENGSFKIQVWTAEMWSWLWNAFKVAEVRVHPEMAFAWAPHHISDWYAKKMMHLAGVTGSEKGAFFKGKYSNTAPWEVEQDFDFVDRTRCWTPYVELIEEYAGLSPHKASRAVVAYLDNNPAFIGQAKILLECLKYIQADDTDLVLFGPQEALEQVPNHSRVVKVIQPPHPLAGGPTGYGYINSIWCLNGPGSDTLDRYEYLLKSDLDVFLTPAWNTFRPELFVVGQGFYSNSEEIRQKCKRIAEDLGLTHRGKHNLGSTLYGRTFEVRAVCKLATEVCEYLLQKEFIENPGAWPGWYRGVSSMYATEIALNHLIPCLAGPSPKLDYYSTSTELVSQYPHIHCWHTEEMFSKFQWERGNYRDKSTANLDLGIVREYCLAMALRSVSTTN